MATGTGLGLVPYCADDLCGQRSRIKPYSDVGCRRPSQAATHDDVTLVCRKRVPHVQTSIP
jgi:hypothetical protein